MAEGGPSSMDIDRSMIQHGSHSPSTPGDFNRRPHFLRHEKLKETYGCALCKDVLLQPHQTPCGQRVCKKCIEDRFGDELNITCPLPHDDMEDEEEPCQREGGLKRTEIMPDSVIQKKLLGEKCFCRNKDYGCCENPSWKKLKIHQDGCIFTPIICSNVGCGQKIAECKVRDHKEACAYRRMLLTPEKDSKDDDDLCFECSQCQKMYSSKEEMEAHQKINYKCVTKPGKCFYYESCSFTAKDVEELKRHLQDPSALSIHLDHQTTQNLRRDQPRIVSLNTITKKKLQMVENPSDADEVTAPVCDAVQSRDGNLEE